MERRERGHVNRIISENKLFIITKIGMELF